MKIRKLLLLSFVLISLGSRAQIGGSHTYEFLNLPNSARISAMGGNFLAIKDDDITLALANPSIIDAGIDNHLALSIVDYFSDINYGFAAYGKTFKKVGSFAATMQYINYGHFIEADELGQTYGNFTAGEYALNLGWGRKLDPHFLIGANLKLVYSGLEKYHSAGIAVDVAGSYVHEKSNFMTTLLFRNIGRQLVTYTKGNPESLPFEIQLGLSKQFAHVPLRFSILLNHLEKFDLTWSDPNNPTPLVDPLTGDSITQNKLGKFADKAMRHVVVGAEFFPTKNFSVRLGYNYQRRRELRVDGKKGIVGFSFGFGFRVSKFNFSYAWAKYHPGGAPNTFTITTNLGAFSKKK